ncbi:MAG TPA: trypsin-like peptidase domain-containing protein [Candidatus Didemnitutus sp.]|nr:trypsin-like peptidase domain-containing protein [Candidatus Didemnitutus sp.]
MNFVPSSARAIGAGLSLLVFAGSPLHAADVGKAAAPVAAPAPTPAPSPAAVSAATPAPNPPIDHSVENAVVKVFSTMRYPDSFRPWTKQAPTEATGTGLVIEGRRILTNAHVVLYASEVQIQASQAGDKISAKVESIAPGIDLAVLKLDDDSFFDSHPALALANKLPEIKDPVLVYGYPTGGSTLSITKGIVSRIEFTSYNFPTSGLRIQIDAAINPGNSGGPALVGDKVIGLAFSHLSNAENIGYIIPCEEIELFLKDVADGHYDGKPAIFDEFQTLENPALRKFLHLDKSVEGMVVHEIDDPDPAYPLKEWDVITAVDGQHVNDQGKIKLTDQILVQFSYLIQKTAHNGHVPLTIVRNGKSMAVDLPVNSVRPMLVYDLAGAYPSYFVYGPIVFSAATAQFAGGLAGNGGFYNWLSAGGSPLVNRRFARPATPDEQLVVISSPFFPHKLVNGYGNPTSHTVKTINGTAIKNLKHLVEVLRDCKDEFITIEFVDHFAEALVLPRADCLAATEEILIDNGVRSQGSPDVMTVWKAKAP